jgi:hypothetical protein
VEKKTIMSVFKLGLALIFVSCIVVSCLELDDDSTRGLIIRQFLDKYQPALLVHPTMRRFRRFNYVGVRLLEYFLNELISLNF